MASTSARNARSGWYPDTVTSTTTVGVIVPTAKYVGANVMNVAACWAGVLFVNVVASVVTVALVEDTGAAFTFRSSNGDCREHRTNRDVRDVSSSSPMRHSSNDPSSYT